ncbi:MAG: hypothetical protein V4724_31720 [Pseudomonadota bacterium]
MPDPAPAPTPVPDPVPVPTSAPLISSQPLSQSVAAGAAVTLSVAGSGGALGYQWTRNGVAVTGATAASYTLPSVQPADNAAVWRAIVVNALGVTTSAPALLTVGGAGMRPLAGVLDDKAATARQHTFDDNIYSRTFSIGPTGIAGDGKGGFYVSSVDKIYRVSAGGQVAVAATVPGCDFYRGALDKDGNLYVPCVNVIYKLAQNGAMSFVAGNRQVFASVDGTAGVARFGSIGALAFDSKGVLHIADSGNRQLRRMDADGRVTTFAGSPELDAPKDGTGRAAGFSFPQGLAFNAQDLLYVTDGGDTVRTVTPAGVVSTLAGKSGVRGWADGAGAAARFNNALGIAVDAAGNAYVADAGNNAIRKITAGGQVGTVAGRFEQKGSADGFGSLALFDTPSAVTMGADGNVYVADTRNDTIRRVTPASVVTTLAGTPVNPTSSGSIDGLGQEARFYNPRGIAVDAGGNVIVGDSGNHNVRKISAAGVVTTVSGFANSPKYKDGMAPDALFYGPDQLTIDGGGNVYLLDDSTLNNSGLWNVEPIRVRKIARSGAVTTVVLPADPGNVAKGSPLIYPAMPMAIVADAAGNLYVSANVITEIDNCHSVHNDCPMVVRTAVRKIAPDGSATTLAAVSEGDTSGRLPRSMARNPPAGIAVDGAGNVYLADTYNHQVLKVTPNGAVTTLAGSVQGAADGQGTAARFSSPTRLVADAAGNVYVVDSGNYTVRKIAPDGTVTTVAGTAGRNELVLGALPGSLTEIGGIALDAQGNLYVTLSNGVLKIAR